MRNNSDYYLTNNINLTNNNSTKKSASRYYSVDNTLNYYNNAKTSGRSWSRKNQNLHATQESTKEAFLQDISSSNYRQTSVYWPLDSAYCSDVLTKTLGDQRSTNGGASSKKGQGYVYKEVRQSEEYVNDTKHNMREYNSSKNQLRALKSDIFKEQEQMSWKARITRRTKYLENIPDRNNVPNSTPDPSWDSILSEVPTQYHTSDQHYEHYFSYFYNRGTEKVSNLPLFTINRKLPMTEVQNPSGRRDPRDVNVTTAGQRESSKGAGHDSPFESHVLKEKLPSNYLSNDYSCNGWGEAVDYPESLLQKAGEEYLDLYDSEAIIETQFDPIHRRLRLPEKSAIDYSGVDSANNNNTSTEKPLDQSHPPCLPINQKRNKGNATSNKKSLPTVHRVLLYSTQSPRMGRKQQHATHRNLNFKNQISKSVEPQDDFPAVLLVEPESKDEVYRSHTDSDRNTDFDDDDDLDNISNFDESDTESLISDAEDGYRAHAYKLTHSVDRISSPQSGSSFSAQSSEGDLKNPESLLVPSLFPFVPPYLSFSSNTSKGPRVPPELHRVLKWRVTNIMPKVVRLILANSGMRMLKKTNDWMGVWGKHLRSPCFKTIRSYQKINHLPGSFRIGRKDSCWKNLQRQMGKHSNKEFGFMPRTYIIPNDLCALRRHWPKYSQRNTKWIIKPPASARGAGIRVINRWGQIPKRRPLIVQKYIERPLLINGSKFDLRLYVLVTSVNPLRVFMYHNGLARFASVKYSSRTDTLGDRCMHLTNYSINKFSSNYSKNEDVNACHGHKWTIKSLWTYLANRGVRTDCLWEALRSLVLRTIIAGENGINSMIRANVESKYSCFELFGFDVILDSDLVPWLLEVNISPSLHSELPLDSHVKAPLVQGVLNTALYNVPPKLSQEKQKELAAEMSFPTGTQMCYDKRLYINYLSREEKEKHNTFTRKSMEDRNEYINDILDNLTPDDVRCLIIAEDELARCAPLERIFPTDQTHKYLKYNDTPRYYNRLLDAWESRYANNRAEGIALLRDYCQNKYHLQVPTSPNKKVMNDSCEELNLKTVIYVGQDDTNA
ncbi:tubulin polyglutamylase TTLL4 isoform X1 [Drosophila guanche]|uniref:Blast:Tubulin polyglutamylase TTLL4 n=2 Tax=Drosophila guanche TaxID=7266 RepID=A0A3B0JH68_DROGU|nr:tubulin polyglutamylase TTLL4 isoform X1 [Drosophila guanche]SPP81697.1 blast:Tubulin polyglutamylase TTLL4 [Drosophila guanche]